MATRLLYLTLDSGQNDSQMCNLDGCSPESTATVQIQSTRLQFTPEGASYQMTVASYLLYCSNEYEGFTATHFLSHPKGGNTGRETLHTVPNVRLGL